MTLNTQPGGEVRHAGGRGIVLDHRSSSREGWPARADREAGSPRNYGIVGAAYEDVGPETGRVADHVASHRFEESERVSVDIVVLNHGPDPYGGIVGGVEALLDTPFVHRRGEVVQPAAAEEFDALAIGCFYDTALLDAREVSGDMVVTATCRLPWR